MCRAAMTSCTVDIPARSAPTARMKRISAGVSNCGPSHARVDAFRDLDPETGRSLTRSRAQLRVVGVAHVREARPERVVVRPDERRCALQVDVVGDEDEQSRPVVRC